MRLEEDSMSQLQHTVAETDCQLSGREDTSRVTRRFGAPALADGFTALPTRLLVRHAHLGVTRDELAFIAVVVSYQWGDEPPYPSQETIARNLEVDVRTVRRYATSLVAKRFLHIIERREGGRAPSHAYDLRPLWAALGALNITSGRPRPADNPGDNDRTLSSAESDQPVTQTDCDYDMTPLPPIHTDVTEADGMEAEIPAIPRYDDPAYHLVASLMAPVSATLGDRTQRSSATRAYNHMRAAHLAPAGLAPLLTEALARVRSRDARQPMAYFFATLESLIAPVETPPRGGDRAWKHQSGTRAAQPRVHAREGGHAISTNVSSRAPEIDGGDELWSTALRELRDEMTPENYARWFEPTRAVRRDHPEPGVLLEVAVPDAFHQQWLDRKLRGAIERALGRAAPNTRVTFTIGSAARLLVTGA